MVLAIRCLFQVDYCFTNMSYDGIIYYLIFRYWLRLSALFNRTNIIKMYTRVTKIKYSMHYVQDYSVLYNNVVRPAIYEA